jgi:hypothetical protein
MRGWLLWVGSTILENTIGLMAGNLGNAYHGGV